MAHEMKLTSNTVDTECKRLILWTLFQKNVKGKLRQVSATSIKEI